MKKEKFNGKKAAECQNVDWEQLSKSVSPQARAKRSNYEWDVDDVDETWSIEFDENGNQLPRNRKKLNKKIDENTSSNVGQDDLSRNIMAQTLNQIASEGILKADGAFVTGEIDALAIKKAETGLSTAEIRLREELEAKERARAKEKQQKNAVTAEVPVVEVDENGDEISLPTVNRTADSLENEAGTKEGKPEYERKGNSDVSRAASRIPGNQINSTQKKSDKKDSDNKSKKEPAKRISEANERAIKKSVDDKIIVRSEELKAKRKAEEAKKAKSTAKKSKKNNSGSKKEKYQNLGEIPSLENNKKASKFRRESANWRYDSTKKAEVTDEKIDEAIENESFIEKIRSFTPVQYMAAGMAVVILITSVMTTGVYASYRGVLNKNEAFSQLPTFTQIDRVAYDDNNYFTEEFIIDEAAEENNVLEEHKMLSLVLTSVEKDLKIKLVDDEDTLVKDIPWGVVVTDSDGDANNYQDDDEDGVIHLTGISAGDYSVSIEPSEALKDYTFPSIGQEVSVKAKIEYKVIANIKDEIKKESEVNVALEDNGNKAADVETGAVLQDTVEWVESTQVDLGETKENTNEADDYEEAEVDLSKTEKVVAFAQRLVAAVKNLAVENASIASSKSILAVRLFGVTHVADEETQNQESDASAASPETQDSEAQSSETSQSEQQNADSSSDNNASTSSSSSSASSSSSQDTLAPAQSSSESTSSSSMTSSSDSTSSSSDANASSSSSSEVEVIVENTSSSSSSSQNDTIIEEKNQVIVENKPVDQNNLTVQDVKVKSSASVMKIGETVSLTLFYTPEKAIPESITWASSDTSIASVNDGVVTAYAPGQVRVGAIVDGSIVAYCELTVSANEAASASLVGPKSVAKGEKITVEAKLTPQTDTITEWKTDNKDIVSIVATGNKAEITGVTEGVAVVRAISSSKIEAVCEIEVTAEGKYADNAQLYDSNKNKLYVYDEPSYRLATYADYKSGLFTKFFRKKSEVVYTGWQTINGVTYYYTENHEKVTGDQVIGGITYHFGEDGALAKGSGVLGIDVSKYQPTINWSSVKASGVNYVIIRCGYRGASTGSLIQDPYFVSHIKGAKAAGLKVGVYFFSTALNEAEAVEEASMCAALCSGYGINYPVFIDVEPSSRPGYNGLSTQQRTANIKAFCSTISSAGYTPGLYANKTWLSSYIDTSQLGCKIWLAQYNSAGPTYNGHYDIWQYTSKGKVDGISGNVDMNMSYMQ